MKSILTIFTLVFTVMFSSTSFAGWTKVLESAIGDVFYVDFERIRIHDGYVYFWTLNDYLKPNKYGELSSKQYKQGDCTLFRVKTLSYVYHKLPMGGDIGETSKPIGENGDWRYPPPSSVLEYILKEVCSR